jgi:beta-lactam-binding protein with PASTA domain
MGKLSFLKQKKFYINFLIIILLSFILLWLTIKMLNVYTRHGKVYEMPDFIGMTIDEVEKNYGKDYNFILIDSVYSKTQEPGSIVQQDPLVGSKVKHGRNVYYIIVAKTPEKTSMPNLNNLSLRQALVLLESSGLVVDELTYVEHFARNAIREQRYENKVIKPGTVINKGSKIRLYVGRGTDNRNAQIPSLYGTAASNAKRTLNMAGLNLGEEVYEDHDSIQYMMVYKMDPPHSSRTARPGTFVKLWYRSSRKFDFKQPEPEEIKPEDTIPTIDTTKNEETIDNIEENYEDDF